MKVKISEPTKAYFIDYTPQDIEIIEKQLSYKDSSIEYLISKHKSNRWLKKKNPKGWQAQLERLQEQLNSSLLFKDERGYFVRSGIVPYINNVKIDVINAVDYPVSNPYPWVKKPEFEPYPYQRDSVRLLIKEKHGCVSLATGMGKSLILLLMTQELGLPAVIVTPSQSIFTELFRLFKEHLGEDKVGGYGDGYKDIKKPITISIAKSLTNLKEGTPEYKFFQNKSVFLSDESHTLGADTLERVAHGCLDKIPYRFFFSATQTRGDGTEKLLYSIIGREVLNIPIGDGIQQGFLCPLKFIIVKTISPSTLDTFDPMECKRNHFLYNKNIAEIAAKIAHAKWDVKKESTLILVEELIQIKMLKDLINIPMSYVHSASKKDAAEYGLEAVNTQDEIERFNKGEVRVLIGTKAIATGTNLYPTHNTINWSGGSSEIMTKQGAMGRSTRKLENSKYKEFHVPKPFTTIFDFDVEGQVILKSQLKNRIEYYKESECEIKFA